MSSPDVQVAGDSEVAGLVRRWTEAAQAYVSGDMVRYVELARHDDEFTLLPPYGGGPERHLDRGQRLTVLPSSLFAGGEAELEDVQAHAWADTVVLALIERQHGRMGDRPDRDWSLRVTLVFRRSGDSWRLVHRHADPIVPRIDLPAMEALIDG